MTFSEEDREKWLAQPRASNEMRFHDEGFKAFSRLFIPKLPKNTDRESETGAEGPLDEH